MNLYFRPVPLLEVFHFLCDIPLMSSELLHSSIVSVFEVTYFFALLIPDAIGSSSLFTYGQCAANISYVFLPSNRSKG
jgi:hypothetical protein